MGKLTFHSLPETEFTIQHTFRIMISSMQASNVCHSEIPAVYSTFTWQSSSCVCTSSFERIYLHIGAVPGSTGSTKINNNNWSIKCQSTQMWRDLKLLWEKASFAL